MGALACLVATTCYGFAGFLARRWLDQRGGLDSRLSALGSMLGATLFLLPLFAYSAISHPPASWGGWPVWGSLLGLGLVCTALAYVLYFRLLTAIGPVRSMTTTFLIPPFGVLWGALLLGEPLSMAHVYGGLLIAGALWMVLRPEPEQRPEPVPRRVPEQQQVLQPEPERPREQQPQQRRSR